MNSYSGDFQAHQVPASMQGAQQLGRLQAAGCRLVRWDGLSCSCTVAAGFRCGLLLGGGRRLWMALSRPML